MLLLAIGGLQRRQFLALGFGNLLGDLVLDADQDPQRLRGELAVGQHRELVAHLADALAKVGDCPGVGGRGVVELMGQAGGDGAQRQQLLALADDLALPRPPTMCPSSRCTAIGNSDCMKRANASGSRTKNRDGLVTRTDAS